MKVTNTQAGPRGLNTVKGPVLVEPGETVTVEVYAREREHLEASGWFTIEGEYLPDPGAMVGQAILRDFDDGAAVAGLKEELRASSDKLKAAEEEATGLKAKISEQASEIEGLKAQLAKASKSK